MREAPRDRTRLIFTALFAVWVLTFAYSFVAYARAPYEGAGFPDGLNKPAVFLGWQGIAGMIALAIFGVSRAWPKGAGPRLAGAIPIILSLAIGVGVLGILFWAETASG